MSIIERVSQWWSNLWRSVYAWFDTTTNAKPIPQPKIKKQKKTPQRRKSDRQGNKVARKSVAPSGWKWTELDFLEWIDTQTHEDLMRMYESGSEFPVVMSNNEYGHWNKRWIDFINDYVTKWNTANGVVPRKFNGME
jgi:hypothetical protein